MKLYEGMFVIDAGRAARDWEGTLGAVTSVLEKHGGSMEKGWRFEERKLAYPIQGVRRGVYLLQYFQADPEAIAEMRVDLNLSEYVLRYMILRVESGEAPETPTLGTATPVPADTAIPSRDEPAEPATPVEEKVEAPAEAEAPDEEEADEEKAPVGDEAATDEPEAPAEEEAPKEEAPAGDEAEAPAEEAEAPAEEAAPAAGDESAEAEKKEEEA